SGVVYCCFNASYKITPAMFELWMRVLGRVPQSVLWLPEGPGAVAENLRREAQARQVDPARLIFAPRVPSNEEHLARLGAADLFLDTLPYNAHSTAMDALACGVPVLTLPGEAFASRVGASVLRAIALPELIAADAQAYTELAVELGRSPEKL